MGEVLLITAPAQQSDKLQSKLSTRLTSLTSADYKATAAFLFAPTLPACLAPTACSAALLIQWPSGLAKFVIFGKLFCFIGHLAEIVELQSVANHRKKASRHEYSTFTRMQHPGMMYVRVRVPVFARVPY